MLGLPASVKAPALAATGGRAVAQLKAPFSLTELLDVSSDLTDVTLVSDDTKGGLSDVW